MPAKSQIKVLGGFHKSTSVIYEDRVGAAPATALAGGTDAPMSFPSLLIASLAIRGMLLDRSAIAFHSVTTK